MTALLEVEDLRVEFRNGRTLHAVNGLSFALAPGEMLGLVGESGCGKSVTSLAVMGLLPPGTARITGGRIAFDGRDLTGLPESTYRKLRGRDLAMIFQDPMSGLNPVLTVGEQITEIYRTHARASRKAAIEAAAALLSDVGIPDARAALKRYPHEFSGGMQQRVMIAMALALRPKLIIADEPTTALDPTVEAQILDLLRALIRKTGSAMILISHDFDVVAEMVDRVAVMYAGRIVETAPVDALLTAPRHPYARDLMACLPSRSPDGVLSPIEGGPPALSTVPGGCLYAERCKLATALCRYEEPLLADHGASDSAMHLAACHHAVVGNGQNSGSVRLAPRQNTEA